MDRKNMNMITEQSKEDGFLPSLEAKVLVETIGRDGKRIGGRSVIVGAKKGVYLAVDTPTVQGALITSLAGSDNYIVRLLDDETLLGFKCRIISSTMSPAPIIFLTFPSHIERMDKRLHRRFEVRISAGLSIQSSDQNGPAGPFTATVRDMSKSGCKITTDVFLSINQLVFLSIPYSAEQNVELEATVIHKDDSADHPCIYGLEFSGISHPMAERVLSRIIVSREKLQGEFQELLMGIINQLYSENESEFNQRLDHFISELLTDFNLNDIVNYKRLITRLIKEYTRRNEETTKMLHEILDRLLELEQEFVDELLDKERGALENGLALNRIIRSEVISIRENLDKRLAPSELKDMTIKGLDLIRATIRKKRTQEKNKFIELEESVHSLQKKFTEVRREFEEAKGKAEIDDLTQIPNRRALNRRVNDEIIRHQRYGRPCTLLMFDVDNFKAINDKYGHLNGDQILKELCEVVKEHVREVDFFARFGGDEFVIVLPETSLQEGYTVAEKIRKMIFSIDFQFGAASVPVTICLGVGCIKPDDEIGDAIGRADQAMLSAKHLGRNRTELSTC
ncbi:MAG: diguanylate cyclase [Deltaproteobacteria bacterium]|nr:diguanylate cyclase [Deltaproteobacteria bacterium]